MAGRKPRIYILPEFVNGRPTADWSKNAAYQILEDAYDALPEYVQERFDGIRAAEERSKESLRLWAKDFIEALESGGPYPTRTGRLVWEDDDRFTHTMTALAAVWVAAEDGVTVHEIKVGSGRISNAIGGALSDLHQVGVIEMLVGTR